MPTGRAAGISRANDAFEPLAGFLSANLAGGVYVIGDAVEIPPVLGQLRLAGERCSGPW
jgi:hypothetical protein